MRLAMLCLLLAATLVFWLILQLHVHWTFSQTSESRQSLAALFLIFLLDSYWPFAPIGDTSG